MVGHSACQSLTPWARCVGCPPIYDVLMTSALPIRAVLWDFGGVILSSPFEAFNRYEADHGLPREWVRRESSTPSMLP